MQQAARVVPQVEHQALHLPLLEQALEVLHHALGGSLLELRDADPGIARLDHLRFHALHADHRAGQRDHQRRALALARDGERDLRVRLAAHLLHGRVVELDDQVARLDAGLERRRVLDRRDHLDEAVLHPDLDAEAAELALRADLQLFERLRIEIGRMRVEPREHAVDRLGDQLLVLDRLDVVGLDGAEHLGEGAQLLDRQSRAPGPLGDRLEIQADEDARDRAEDDEADAAKLAVHRVSLISGAYFNLTQRSGSKARPKCRSSKYKPVSSLPPLDPVVAIASPAATASPTCLSSDSLLA